MVLISGGGGIQESFSWVKIKLHVDFQPVSLSFWIFWPFKDQLGRAGVSSFSCTIPLTYLMVKLKFFLRPKMPKLCTSTFVLFIKTASGANKFQTDIFLLFQLIPSQPI